MKLATTMLMVMTVAAVPMMVMQLPCYSGTSSLTSPIN